MGFINLRLLYLTVARTSAFFLSFTRLILVFQRQNSLMDFRRRLSVMSGMGPRPSTDSAVLPQYEPASQRRESIGAIFGRGRVEPKLEPLGHPVPAPYPASKLTRAESDEKIINSDDRTANSPSPVVEI